MPSLKKVLVVGSGGREHALALRLLGCDSVGEVIVTPGNAGTAGGAAPKKLANAVGEPLELARDRGVDLVVIGPEAPLCDGIVDRLAGEGIAAFGPTKSAARLEASKAFMKDFASRHGIRTARHQVVRDAAAIERAIGSFDTPPVVKADGLCAGKGVVVSRSKDEALEAARAMLVGGRFGEAGKTVVVEERVHGAEASVHAMCAGSAMVVLPTAQDHKRIGEGDTGPNTGGMGAYAPAPLVTADLADRIRKEILQPALDGMAAEGSPYRGALFAGLMITPSGDPYLLEFNVRFGDPETQVLMNLVEGDLAQAMAGAARGELDPGSLSVAARHAMCVVLAAKGYPGSVRTGDPIDGLDEAGGIDGVIVYHAGTKRDGDRVITSGGRVLGVTAKGATLREARKRAYRAVDAIHFEGKQVRRDIGARALGEQ